MMARDALLSEYTSMKVGGPAREVCEPADEAAFIDCIKGLRSKGAPYFVMGNGTNVVVRDGGYAGAVVLTVNALRGLEARGNGRLVCGAGESLARVCRYAAEQGLSGIEGLSGIPGTVGGAVFMNAGAYGYEIKAVLVSARAYNANNETIIMLSNEECEFAYRTSVFRRKPMLILSAEFALWPADREEIEHKMSEFTRLRNEKQPLDLPSAGSFFKRPENDFAGRLIEAAGMKGARVGGAQVSEKHAGFIVNTGGATARDILGLAAQVKANVFEKFDVELEAEPVIMGEDEAGK